MKSKEALEALKKDTTETKGKTELPPKEVVVEPSDKDSELPALTAKQQHNMGHNLHAVHDTVQVHQAMLNDIYKSLHAIHSILVQHKGSHELTQKVLAKLISESNKPKE